MLKNKIGSTIIFAIIQIIMLLILALKGRTDYSWSIFVTTGAWIVYTILEVKFDIKISQYIRIVMMLTLFADAFFGYYLSLYEKSLVFDKILHVFGTYSITLFFYSLIIKMQNEPLNKIIIFIFIVCLGLSIGSVYEILEFIGDNVSHPEPPNQPSLLDTDLDLIGDLLGALIAGIHASYRKFISEYF